MEYDNNVKSNENNTQQPCPFHDQAMRWNAVLAIYISGLPWDLKSP